MTKQKQIENLNNIISHKEQEITILRNVINKLMYDNLIIRPAPKRSIKTKTYIYFGDISCDTFNMSGQDCIFIGTLDIKKNLMMQSINTRKALSIPNTK